MRGRPPFDRLAARVFERGGRQEDRLDREAAALDEAAHHQAPLGDEQTARGEPPRIADARIGLELIHA